jgi:SnoaL-like domain
MIREHEPQATAALVAVQRLQAAYGDAVTRRAWDEVVALFEPDATVHIDTRAREPFTLEGAGAIAGFVERSLDQFAFFEFAILNSVVELGAGDEATGRVHLCEVRRHHDGSWTQAYGLYQDRYRRGDGSWRIAGRRYSSLARHVLTGIEQVESFPLPPTQA